MRSIKIISLICITLSYLPDGVAKSSLPQLITKQAIHNIRFMDKEGKFTYYKRKSGDLLLSTNFDSKTILKGKSTSNFLISGSSARKKLAIEQDDGYLNAHNLRANNQIYIADFGVAQANLTGAGQFPQLHLKDSWLSYYDIEQNQLILKPIIKQQGTTASQITIKLRNRANPYFIPEVTIVNPEEVLYTDINQDGLSAIIYYNTISKDIRTVYKSQRPGHKLEICKNGKSIFFAEFSQVDISPGFSSISMTAMENILKPDDLKNLYKSPLSDIGNIICNIDKENLYFIQVTKKNSSVANQDLVSLNISSKKIEKISDLKYVTQAVNMDGRILIPFQGVTYIALGANSVNYDKLSEEGKDKKEKGGNAKK